MRPASILEPAVPALRVPVRHILRHRSAPQMLRLDAPRPVALVQNLKPRRNRTDINLVRKPVRIRHSFPVPQPAIPTSRRPTPHPAPRRTINLRPRQKTPPDEFVAVPHFPSPRSNSARIVSDADLSPRSLRAVSSRIGHPSDRGAENVIRSIAPFSEDDPSELAPPPPAPEPSRPPTTAGRRSGAARSSPTEARPPVAPTAAPRGRSRLLANPRAAPSPPPFIGTHLCTPTLGTSFPHRAHHLMSI